MHDEDRTRQRPDDEGNAPHDGPSPRPDGDADDPTLATPPPADDDADATLATPPPADDSDATLATPPPVDATLPGPGQADGVPDADADSDRIGPYRLVRRIGEGGMGEVFEAQQLYPLRRKVALKIVKKGLDTAEFVSRFESERQALALMDHPGIARVFDAGATPRGRPYFVMEFVDGVPLSEYCDAHRLPLVARLRLFIHVCEGVQHAHQKAIIHRDLKPSNVLVGEVDGHPQPKIIDFGVAKAMDRELVANTLRTGVGQILGTPAYMAPEQADFDVHDVDTRADVYALGVILYELLAGERPFAKEELEAAGFREALRMIREDDPPRPSARFATLAERRDAVAAARGADPASLRRRLRGDLDWIAMKALAKEPDRRYETASGLARDVRRYLDFKPVSAGPPTARYRVGKFIRRHRVGVLAGALVTAALVLGVTGTTVGLIRAVEAERIASEEARTATRVTDFLVGLFEVSDPDATHGETVTAREILDQGASRIEDELADEPLVRARLKTTIGKVYRNLGLYEAARPYLESAVAVRRAADDPRLAVSLAELGDLYIQLGRYDDAVATLEESLDFMGGRDDPDQLVLASSLHELANVLRRQGHFDAALPHYERARRLRVDVLGEDHPDVARTDNSMAALFWGRGDYEEAERRYRNALRIWEAAYGDDHSDVAKGLNNLGLLFTQLDRFEEAEDLFLRAVPIYERILGAVHPRVARAVNNLALTVYYQERYDEAEVHYRRALSIAEEAYGADHPEYAAILNNLGNVARDRERWEKAEAYYADALRIRRERLGADHPLVAWTLRDLGVMHRERGAADEAVSRLRQARDLFVAANGPDHPELAEILHDYAGALDLAVRPEEAAATRDRAAAIRALHGLPPPRER